MYMFEISNELGQISFSKNVIYKICADAVELCDGNARIQNYKGRYDTKRPGLLTVFSQGDDDLDDVEIQMAGKDMAIKIYIVTRFGVSISATAETIIDHVYEQTQQVFGVRPVSVTVVITGIASKTIARRHIEFSR